MTDPGTPDPQPQAARLAPAYDSCLVGATVSIHEESRFAYSLRKLIKFEMVRGSIGADEAREEVANELIVPIQREHGPLAPIFIDDELVQGQVEEDPGPKIVIPNFNGKRPG